MSKKKNDELITEHYRREAQFVYNYKECSLMKDEIVRDKEIKLILNFFSMLETKLKNREIRVLDLGCGNGYTLNIVADAHPEINFFGVEFTDELLSIVKNIKLSNCKIVQGKAQKMQFQDSFFDVIYTQRCLINILDWEEQKIALQEIHRILKSNGYYLMIECFTDGLINYNRARKECGLDELPPAYHNRYFEKDLFMKAMDGMFSIIEPIQIDPGRRQYFHSNFLSSHYFISRVLHALVTKNANFVRNSEFVKFFSFLEPHGNYSPIQAYILQKIDDPINKP